MRSERRLASTKATSFKPSSSRSLTTTASNPTMVDYTTPVTTAFEMQRTTIEQSQKALEQSVSFQKNVNSAVIDSLDTQESAQRRGVELQQTAFHSYLDAMASTMPGMTETVEQIRETVDEQFDFLLENHAELFDNMETELEEGVDT